MFHTPLEPIDPVARATFGMDDSNDSNLDRSIEKNDEVGKFLEENSPCSAQI